MFLDNDSQSIVDLFWQLCGEIERYPRQLERSIVLALPLRIVKLPDLELHKIESWLVHRRSAFRFNCQSRAVRGCLIAYRGKGLIFLDGSDSEDEQRFTLAHEVAHFMVDYWLPRRKALERFGDTIAEVVDGLRSPTTTERIHAVLTQTPIGVHTNLMERNDNRQTDPELWQIENRADKVALVLLASPDVVLQRKNLSAKTFEERINTISAVLQNEFGLPENIATSYGWSLLTSIGKGPSWVEKLAFNR